MRFLSRTQLGNWGENYAIGELSRNGLIVTRSKPHEGDLLVLTPETGQLNTIEVKMARWDKNHHFQVCCKKKGHTNCAEADYTLILLNTAWNICYPFFIASDCIDTNKITISSHPLDYAGRWALYRYPHFRGIADYIRAESRYFHQ